MLKIHLMYSFGPTPEASLSDRGWFIPADIFAQEDSVGVARINYQHNLMLVLCVRIGAVDIGCDILICDFRLDEKPYSTSWVQGGSRNHRRRTCR